MHSFLVAAVVVVVVARRSSSERSQRWLTAPVHVQRVTKLPVRLPRVLDTALHAGVDYLPNYMQV